MSDARNTIESNKIAESNRFSEEFQTQMLSMLERLIPKEIQKVEVTQKPERFSLTRVKRATSTATSKPTEPTKKFKNPIDKQGTTIDEISLIPNSTFKTKGKVIVSIDGATLFENEDYADFTDVSDSGIRFKIGKTIESAKEVEVYVWSDDGTSVSLTVQVTFGE